MRTVLVTGAAGLFGSILRDHWAGRYQLRLADIKAVNSLAAHEQYVPLDIRDLEHFASACEGIHTVVHLAAYPGDGAEFYNILLERNIVGAYNAFEAAKRAGCRRLVFASSIDAVGGYWDDGEIDVDIPVYPRTEYAATKCWGEAVGRIYAEQHNLSCVCVRLCNPHFDQGGDWSPDDLISGLTPRDAADLLGRCVDVEDLDYSVINGISRHERGVLDWRVAHRVLGFVPQDGSAYPRTSK